MAQRFVCNVHGGVVDADEFHEVVLHRAAMPGPNTRPGELPHFDTTVQGQVCPFCFDVLAALLEDRDLPELRELIEQAGKTLRLDAETARQESEDAREGTLKVA